MGMSDNDNKFVGWKYSGSLWWPSRAAMNEIKDLHIIKKNKENITIAISNTYIVN